MGCFSKEGWKKGVLRLQFSRESKLNRYGDMCEI